VGATTAAAAAGLFRWDGWAESPDITYSFTLPSGRQCEERILINDTVTAGDGIATPSPRGAAIKEWARSADFNALIDVPAELAALDPADGMPRAEKEAGRIQPNPDGPDALMIVLLDDGGLNVVPKTDDGPSADDLYANAVNTGLSRVIQNEASGIEAGPNQTPDWSTNLQMQCEPAK
jgi:hypothetical protein